MKILVTSFLAAVLVTPAIAFAENNVQYQNNNIRASNPPLADTPVVGSVTVVQSPDSTSSRYVIYGRNGLPFAFGNGNQHNIRTDINRLRSSRGGNSFKGPRGHLSPKMQIDDAFRD